MFGIEQGRPLCDYTRITSTQTFLMTVFFNFQRHSTTYVYDRGRHWVSKNRQNTDTAFIMITTPAAVSVFCRFFDTQCPLLSYTCQKLVENKFCENRFDGFRLECPVTNLLVKFLRNFFSRLSLQSTSGKPYVFIISSPGK